MTETTSEPGRICPECGYEIADWPDIQTPYNRLAHAYDQVAAENAALRARINRIVTLCLAQVKLVSSMRNLNKQQLPLYRQVERLVVDELQPGDLIRIPEDDLTADPAGAREGA